MNDISKLITEEKKSKQDGFVNVRVAKDVKLRAQEVLQELGLDTSTAIHMFLRKVISYGGIPFEVRLTEKERENKET